MNTITDITTPHSTHQGSYVRNITIQSDQPTAIGNILVCKAIFEDLSGDNGSDDDSEEVIDTNKGCWVPYPFNYVYLDGQLYNYCPEPTKKTNHLSKSQIKHNRNVKNRRNKRKNKGI